MALPLNDTFGNTPLLSLNRFGTDAGGIILAKQESRNPAGSVKCRIAVSMIEDGIQQGKIDKDTVIIEPTSGNTGIGLAFVCAAKGLRLILTMPESMSIGPRPPLPHLAAAHLCRRIWHRRHNYPRLRGVKGA